MNDTIYEIHKEIFICSFTLKSNTESSSNTTFGEDDDEIKKKTTTKNYLFIYIIKAGLKGPIGSTFM